MKTKKRKGQFISMIVIFVILMISGGTLFSAVLAQDQITGTVTYTTNDVNQLFLAKTKANIYEYNIKKELNYSFNIVAEDIGEDGGNVSWDKNIPDLVQINDRFETRLLNHEYGIKSQNRVKGCSRPEIDQSVLQIESENRLQLDFDNPSINCSSEGTRAIVPIKEEHDLENQANNYIHMAYYARALAQKVKDIAPNTVEGTGSASSGCPGSSSDTIDDAKDNAKSNAVSGDSNVASNAYSQTSGQRQSFISGNSDTSYEGTYTETSSSSSSCQYDCPGPDESGSCSTGTEYSYRYEFTADTLEAEYDLEDSENEVMTENGLETIEFDFTYIHELQ